MENAIEDPRCLANALVCGEFGLRFYAAAPLQTNDGHNIGTFCIIDKKQRFLNTDQMAMLQDLAALVVDEMELRLAARITIAKSSQRISELEEELKKKN